MLRFLLVVLTWQFIAQIPSPATAAQQQCYYPKGNPSTTDIPCGDGVNHSHCCRFNSICLSNKLCLRTSDPFVISRASCTDSTWQSENCPSHCTNVSIGGGIVLGLYNVGSSMPSRYCCGTAVSRGEGLSLGCDMSPNPFAIEPGEIIPDRGALKGCNVTESGKPNSACQQNSTCPMDKGSNTVVAVGAGLGVPLGIISFAALSWALWERYQRRKEEANARLLQATSTQVREEAKPSDGQISIPLQSRVLHQRAELSDHRDPIELD